MIDLRAKSATLQNCNSKTRFSSAARPHLGRALRNAGIIKGHWLKSTRKKAFVETRPGKFLRSSTITRCDSKRLTASGLGVGKKSKGMCREGSPRHDNFPAFLRD
jgi:hypothetical protein